jgi:protein TonB
MSNKYIEKTFLYLLVVSLLIHVGVLAALYYLPEAKSPPPEEPAFIDLQQMPELKPKPKEEPRQQEVNRYSNQRMRVERESAPRGRDSRDMTPSSPPQVSAKPQPRVQQREAAPATVKSPLPAPVEHHEAPIAPGSSVTSLLKPKQQQPSQQQAQAQFFPKSSKMTKFEEYYRQKFEKDIEEGNTRFLNTDDMYFGSFLRRFENSVYGVWTYPEEALRNAIEGSGVIMVTFNRQGEITKHQILESTGSRILDNAMSRALEQIGPVGPLPKEYKKDSINFIFSFGYGVTRRFIR